MTANLGTGGPRNERRRGIVDAARTLATDRGGERFTVDQVASLAGVSRRTVFNHFAGLDQLMVAVCEQVLAEVTADLLDEVDRGTEGLRDGDASGRAALAAISAATRGVDLPTAILAIHRTLGGPGPSDERGQGIARTAFDHVAGRLRARLLGSAPALDPVDLELSLALLFHGIATIARLWLDDHADLASDVTAEARADWDRLLDRLLHVLRVGHAG